MAESFTGNPHRDGVIVAAVKQLCSENVKPTTAAVDSLCAKYGPTFDPTTDEEVAAALAILEQQADAYAATLTETENASEIAPATPVDASEPPAALSDPISREQAVENLRLANHALAAARSNITTLTNLRNTARAKLSDALVAWQTGHARVTPLENARREIQSAQLMKQAIKEGRVPAVAGVTCGPSVIDRTAAAYRGGNGRSGGGNAWRRGGIPLRGVQVRPPRLPSER
jgi:hypothetical protein